MLQVRVSIPGYTEFIIANGTSRTRVPPESNRYSGIYTSLTLILFLVIIRFLCQDCHVWFLETYYINRKSIGA